VTPSRRHDWIALAFLALLPLVFFFDVVAGNRAFFVRDLARFHHPSKNVLREIVRGGEFPYWNPYAGAGQPLAANPQNEVFYPPNWMIFFGDFDRAFQLLILLHIFIALIAMYALLRSMNVRPPVAAIGSACFGMGGLMLSYTNLLPFLFSAAWVPLVCLFARRFLLHRSRRDFALASLFLGIQFLVGEPTTILETAILVGAYAAAHAIRSKALQPLLLAAAIFGAGLLAGAVQMLPAVDHVRDSVRSRGLSFEAVSLWSMPPSRLGEWIFPNLLGHTTPVNQRILYWGAGAYGAQRTPWLFSIYAGLLLAVMAAAGLIARARGWPLALAFLIGSIVLALGAHTPLLRLLYDAGLRALRYPEKFILIAVFTIIVFGARTLEQLLDGDRRLRIAALVIAAAVFSVALLIAATSAETFLRFWNFSSSPLAAEMAAIAKRDWLLAAARAGALLLLLAVVTRIRKPLWIALASVFVVADLAPLVSETAPVTDASLYKSIPIAAQKLHAIPGDFRIFHEAAWHQRTPTGAEYVRRLGIEPMPFRNAMFPIIPSDFGLATVMEPDYDLTSLQPTADFNEAAREIGPYLQTWPQPLAAMSNAGFRTMYRPYEDALALARGDVKRMQPVAFLRLQPHPRYYFADQLQTIRDKYDFAATLLRGRFSNSLAFVHGPAFAPAPGVIRQSSATANRIHLDVECGGRGFLVLSVTPHKYWRATIDGRDAKPAVVNIGYQGLEIPPGRHVVELRYRNPLVWIGMAISLITVTGLILIGTMRAL